MSMVVGIYEIHVRTIFNIHALIVIVTSEEGTAYPSGAPQFTPVLVGFVLLYL